MGELAFFFVLVGCVSVTAAWLVWVAAGAAERWARRRECRRLREVLDRSQDFTDRSVANHAAQFLAEAAKRRHDERAAALKEAAK